MSRRKPTHLKLIEGNPGKGKIKPEPAGIGVPRCPDYFNDDHRILWEIIVSEVPKGLLTASDNVLLEGMVVSWKRYRDATIRIIEDGMMITDKDGATRRNPYLMIQSKALEEMNAAGAKMGLSPIDRQKLDLDPRQPGYKDPMEYALGADFRKHSGL